ncbi:MULTISPECIES: sensor histidine kinase [Gracilibacillus]|uniref:sensor histidine kinase n=1 Tax=Gracilibacillus TaxID=74385 RepID=UPI001372A0D0|nr:MULTISPECIES: sensor histidine kinase [Gracilibacillus]
MRESITSNNMNVLQQLEHQTSLVLNEIELLHLDYNWNPEIILSLQNILDEEPLTLRQQGNLNYGEGTLRRKEIATPYIHSIYIFYENDKDNVLTSNQGVIPIDSLYNDDWYEAFDNDSIQTESWIETRDIAEYSFVSPTSVITIYKNLFKTNGATAQGLIVLNIDQRYFENLINELYHYQNQRIFVIDENNQLLYQNDSEQQLEPADLPLSKQEENYSFHFEGDTYIVNQLFSNEYNLRYVSVTEDNVIYQIPNQLRLSTIVLVMLSLILGAATIYYLSQKNAKHVQQIMSILHMNNSEPVPKRWSFKDNEYQVIVQRILKNYLKQSNLEQELKDKQYQLQSAELLALQNQVNPHFLSNTLAIIYWRAMAITGEPNKVTKMLETLSDILNFSLRIKQSTVTLREEIHHTKNYAEIIQIRSDQPFTIKWDYEENLLDIQVLKFMLQPIIENSLTHGIEPQICRELTIKVKVRIVSDNVQVTISDNGIGMSPKRLRLVRERMQEEELSTQHIGLANIAKRLDLIFNHQYDFSIKSEQGCGTSITITHPLKR